MRRIECSRILIAAFLLLLAACTAPPLAGSSEKVFDRAELQADIDPSFRFGLGILSGFDAPAEDPTWQAHDWVLLGVKAQRGDKTDVWFVRLTTLPDHVGTDQADSTSPPPVMFKDFTVPIGMGSYKRGAKITVPIGRVLIKVYDSQGKFIRSSVRAVPRLFPGESLLRTVQNVVNDDAAPRQATGKAGSLGDLSPGFVSLTGTLQPLATSRAMAPIRETIKKDLVRTPSVLGLLLGGLKLRLEAAAMEANAISDAWSNETDVAPRYEVRFPAGVGGQKIMDCRAVVGPALPPYHLTGGVLQFDGVHPDKPQNRLTVRVLAAKRFGANRKSKEAAR